VTRRGLLRQKSAGIDSTRENMKCMSARERQGPTGVAVRLSQMAKMPRGW
jgi:hypothetical protein